MFQIGKNKIRKYREFQIRSSGVEWYYKSIMQWGANYRFTIHVWQCCMSSIALHVIHHSGNVDSCAREPDHRSYNQWRHTRECRMTTWLSYVVTHHYAYRHFAYCKFAWFITLLQLRLLQFRLERASATPGLPQKRYLQCRAYLHGVFPDALC